MGRWHRPVLQCRSPWACRTVLFSWFSQLFGNQDGTLVCVDRAQNECRRGWWQCVECWSNQLNSVWSNQTNMEECTGNTYWSFGRVWLDWQPQRRSRNQRHELWVGEEEEREKKRKKKNTVSAVFTPRIGTTRYNATVQRAMRQAPVALTDSFGVGKVGYLWGRRFCHFILATRNANDRGRGRLRF